MKPVLYLASASPRRREILAAAKIPFKVVKSRYIERPLPGLGPVALVKKHAEAKARKAVLPKNARFVLGADTIVWCGGKILGKPKDWKQAEAMLRKISGRRHFVYTGLALWDREKKRMKTAAEKTAVFIEKLPEKLIAVYPRKIHALDKAGGYAIQIKPSIVRKIEGSYTNVVGLPKERLRKMLRVI